MAFPVVEGTAKSSVNTAGTSHAVTLPASIAASDLVLITMDIGSTSATMNALTDWAELLDEASANGLKIWRYTGAGVPGNPTFTSSASTRSASIAWRISGASKNVAPQIASTGTGSSATPDPPSVTPTGGVVRDYLFIAFAGMAGEEADDDTWANTPPTNYVPNPPLQKACGTAGTNLGGLICAASRQLNTGAAQDPGTFGVDASAAWRSQHIIVHPISQGAATGTVTWAGAATGTRASAGSGSGTIAWAGSATGTNVHSGSATGAITWAGSATGEAPADVKEGSATGAIDWVGSSTGTSVHSGSATGAIAWAGSSSGVSTHKGDAIGSITWVGVASGANVHSGNSVGAITWAGAASGSTFRNGAATGTITWVGVAVGTSVHSGAASGAVTWAGSATGVTAKRGACIGSVTWVGSATGESPGVGTQEGSAEGAITWVGTATGVHIARGDAQGSVTWDGVVMGARSSLGLSVGSITWVGAAIGGQPVVLQPGHSLTHVGGSGSSYVTGVRGSSVRVVAGEGSSSHNVDSHGTIDVEVSQ